MDYHDSVYGDCDISDPLVHELIASPTLVRLRDIEQGGYRTPFFPGAPPTRFQHSVGVFLLLKKFGAPRLEQVAGLLHDISHSAFSHTIDYVLAEKDEGAQSHQDDIHDEFVKNSPVPEICARHNIDIDYILDTSHFPLLERPIPDLCADRLDYVLRDALAFGLIDAAYVSRTLHSLTIQDNRWVFNDYAAARTFAELFLKINRECYASLGSAVMFRALGDYLQHALAKHYITTDDLYTTDTAVLEKIRPHLAQDSRLAALFERMNNRIRYTNDPKRFDVKVKVKSRTVDPLCDNHGVIQRVSDIDPEWMQVIREELRPKEYYLTFER